MFTVPTSTTPDILSYVAENLSSGSLISIIIFVGALSLVFFVSESLINAIRGKNE